MEPTLSPHRTGWHLDLGATCDEVLLLLAREARCSAAGEELTCRYWRVFRSQVRRWQVRRRLTSWDLDDALQQAYFWIQEAIAAYDAAQLTRPRGSSFRTFLNHVCRLRLLDFCRSLGRNRRRYVAHPDTNIFPEPRSSAREHDEVPLYLEEAVNALDPAARTVWDALRLGKRLRDLPETLGVSYRTIKRRWHRLREQLILRLRHVNVFGRANCKPCRPSRSWTTVP
jgi:RNA polymerase sigma factor (sigma-70 family)